MPAASSWRIAVVIAASSSADGNNKGAIARALREQVWPLLESGRVRPVIHSTFAAAQAGDAHALMESNQHIGKIVLTW